MNPQSFVSAVRTSLAALVGLACACTSEPKKPDAQALTKRGEYLVSIAACDDCHSPKVFTNGIPEPDMTRRLSGHPADSSVAAVPHAALAPDRWAFIGNSHMTAWAGPWGISFASNLTPHPNGLGLWTEAQFVNTLRTGTHLGVGRSVLPPMPWPAYRNMTDDDLKAVYAYLRTLPPSPNLVPQPVSPEVARGSTQ